MENSKIFYRGISRDPNLLLLLRAASETVTKKCCSAAVKKPVSNYGETGA